MNDYECFGSLSSILSRNESQLNENNNRYSTEYFKHFQLIFKHFFL